MSCQSGAWYHITEDPTGTFDCKPPVLGKEGLVIDDITMMGVEFFGKLSLLMDCLGGNTCTTDERGIRAWSTV